MTPSLVPTYLTLHRSIAGLVHYLAHLCRFGDYEKALQYAETAVSDNPVDPRLHGNFGVMYYYNFLYDKAVAELRLAIFGGTLEDGQEVKGLPLTGNDVRLAEIYYTYVCGACPHGTMRRGVAGCARDSEQDPHKRGCDV
ncbi:MAG: tetratricopeptide repeat protein [Anaerolineales bacterium]